MRMYDDKYYIDLILKGEINAFSVLVERHKRMVYTFVLNMIKVPEDAEEIAHDAFVKAFRSIGSFRNQSKFSTWLYRIAYNESVSFLRKKKLEVYSIDEPRFNYQEISETDQLINELNSREQKNIIMKALNYLPDDERSLITLYYLQECTIKEIQEITGYSESNIKIKLFRARKRLWDKLKSVFKEKIILNYGK